MKPPNISFVIGCPVRVASIVTDTGWADDVPAKIAMSIATPDDCVLPCIVDLLKKAENALLSLPEGPRGDIVETLPPRQPFVRGAGDLKYTL
jgi:hypothetical protein